MLFNNTKALSSACQQRNFKLELGQISKILNMDTNSYLLYEWNTLVRYTFSQIMNYMDQHAPIFGKHLKSVYLHGKKNEMLMWLITDVLYL